MKILLSLFLLFSILHSGEKKVVEEEEKLLLMENYKKIVHKMYEIKKQQEELQHIYKNIIKVKKETMLKEAHVNEILNSINALPLLEIIILEQNAIGMQNEQILFDFSLRNKSSEEIEINRLLSEEH